MKYLCKVCKLVVSEINKEKTCKDCQNTIDIEKIKIENLLKKLT